MATAFVNGRVFVGDGRVLDKATVVVEGERIVKVGSAKAGLPAKARRVPLDGATLCPGFIDCHVHLCTDGSPDPITALLRQTVPETTLLAAEMARRTVLAGVTTVRDMGAVSGIDLALRAAVRAGRLVGPRMLVSHQLICMTGGHGWHLGRQADGPDEVRRAAREQIKAGADVVKLMATGGVMTPGVEPGSPQFTEEELRAGIEEAHKAGRRTATHAQGTRGVLNALRAGIDSVEHGFFLDDETVGLMVERGVSYVPTLAAVHFIVVQGREAGIPDYAVDKATRARESHLDSVRLARAAGVRIGLGTDAGTPFNLHGQNLVEAELLAAAGMTPQEALQAGTLVAAEVLGLEKELGSVEEGKLADLVLVEGNPLEDLSLLSRPEAIRLVIQGGRVLKDVGD